MRIQVNVCSFKYGHLVCQAVESVLAQTRKPDRILVCDDGVGDCAPALAAGQYASVDLLGREKNMGTVANFADILANHTDADFVMFLGADNYLRPDALELMVGAANAEGADIVSSDIAMVGERGRRWLADNYDVDEVAGYPVWRFNPKGDVHRGTNPIHGSALYRVKLALSVGGYQGPMEPGVKRSNEDWSLWRRMIDAGAQRAHVAEPLLFYRRHAANFNG